MKGKNGLGVIYRMKIRTKGTDARDAIRALIEKHGGKDASSKRSSKAWVVGVFPDTESAKAFRVEARAQLK